MKVYVTGASGFIGRRIVARLLADGHVPIALGRDPARIDAPAEVERRTVDLLDLDTILPAIEDCDAGVHAAGIGPKADARQQQDLNVQASRHLAGAARRKKSLRRLVAITSAAVLEPGDSIYRQYKVGQEAALRITQLELTILRPTMVIGPWQESEELRGLVERTKAGTIRMPGGGRMKVQPVDVDDVAGAAVTAVTLEKGVGQQLVVAGPEGGLPHRELIEAIRDRTGGSADIAAVPLGPMRVAGVLAAMVGRSRAIKSQLAYYGNDHLYSLDETRAALGFDPRPYAETLERAFGPAG